MKWFLMRFGLHIASALGLAFLLFGTGWQHTEAAYVGVEIFARLILWVSGLFSVVFFVEAGRLTKIMEDRNKEGK